MPAGMDFLRMRLSALSAPTLTSGLRDLPEDRRKIHHRAHVRRVRSWRAATVACGGNREARDRADAGRNAFERQMRLAH